MDVLVAIVPTDWAGISHNYRHVYTFLYKSRLHMLHHLRTITYSFSMLAQTQEISKEEGLRVTQCSSQILYCQHMQQTRDAKITFDTK